MSYIAPLLNEQNLHRLAGTRFYERGVDYAANGHVVRLYRRKRSVEAIVQGTRRYRVELWVENGELLSSCTCPMGVGRSFCKHCVATGLAAIEASEPELD